MIRLLIEQLSLGAVNDVEICSKLIDPTGDVSIVLELDVADERKYALLECILSGGTKLATWQS